ncbi:MAG: hypothetical protein VKI81_08515, partial [Synechococcaceae cyanobacterium]|nr:hypothetical protein [Synechococcaceae cyanobacterium]
ALGVDPPATLAALAGVTADLDAVIEREAAWVAGQGEPVLVLADVPPDAARLAERLGAPLLWLASFGWDAIYGPMGGEFVAWAARSRDLYARGDRLLHCPLSLPMDWGVPAVPLGLTSGRPRFAPEVLRRRLALPDDPSRCVLVSFGGLGLPIDPALPARWPHHFFLGPDPVLATLPNGRPLPHDLRPLDGMPLVGRLITKPGYSSFCEALCHGVGIHLVRRSGFAEAPVLEEALQRHGRHRLLSESQLRAGDWELDRPLRDPRGAPLPCDGAATAAREIVSAAEGGSADPIGAAGQV